MSSSTTSGNLDTPQSTWPFTPVTIGVMAAGGFVLLVVIGLLVQTFTKKSLKDIENGTETPEPAWETSELETVEPVLHYRESILRLKPTDEPEKEIVFHLPPAPFSPPPFHHNNPALTLPMRSAARLSTRDSLLMSMMTIPMQPSTSQEGTLSRQVFLEESRSHFIS
ncbi:hypothetical protein EDD86DRAFT_245826 [Gorgonomyces haynaldii]|nr:hypothetical protein EDD86DRAFT_245826 [Gorgonomyces haynaldii]